MTKDDFSGLTNHQKLIHIFAEIKGLEKKLDIVEQHLLTSLNKTESRVHWVERQLYAAYALGAVHLMLMGFVLKKVFL